MARVDFPNIRPTSRSYNPGEYPQTVFQAANGRTTVLRYSNRRVNASLSLGFQNITDDQADLILDNYNAVNSDWDYIRFLDTNATVGVGSSGLSAYMREASSGLRWRYAGPPQVTSVVPGRSTVQCEFIAFLDGN